MEKTFRDFEISDIKMDDYPDFCDAFILSATTVFEDGTYRESTEEELDELNNDADLVYGLVQLALF